MRKLSILCSNCGYAYHGLTPCPSQPPAPPPVDELDPVHVLRDLEAWMRSAINGPMETKGHADNSGHPHFWTALLIPDWQMKQKLQNVSDCLVRLAPHSPQPESE